MEDWEWLELEYQLSVAPHIDLELPSVPADRGVLTEAEEVCLRGLLAATTECFVFGMHRGSAAWDAIADLTEQRARRTALSLSRTDPVTGRGAFWKAPPFERGSVVLSMSVALIREHQPFACARGWGTCVNPGSGNTRRAWDMFRRLEISNDSVHGILPASNGIQWITLRGTPAALVAIISQFAN